MASYVIVLDNNDHNHNDDNDNDNDDDDDDNIIYNDKVLLILLDFVKVFFLIFLLILLNLLKYLLCLHYRFGVLYLRGGDSASFLRQGKGCPSREAPLILWS